MLRDHSGVGILALGFVLLGSVGIFLAMQTERDLFEPRMYVSPSAAGGKMPYRLYIPYHYDGRKKYPLVVWLHGGEGRGSDNRRQITGGNTFGAEVWTTEHNREQFPAFVLAPQCPENRFWANPTSKELTEEERRVLEIIEALRKEFSLDADRFYIAGQSMGGSGAWDLLARRPEMFAAGVVLAARGDPATAKRIAHIPVWVFHGRDDSTVPVEEAQRMVQSLRQAGGNPRYTEYPEVNHVIWDLAFSSHDLVPWLFAQKRSAPKK